MRYIPTVVVAFSCDFVVANPILIKKLSNGQKKATFYFFRDIKHFYEFHV